MEYPTDCETCGDMIMEEEDDYNGMCYECYTIPPEWEVEE